MENNFLLFSKFETRLVNREKTVKYEQKTENLFGLLQEQFPIFYLI